MSICQTLNLAIVKYGMSKAVVYLYFVGFNQLQMDLRSVI